MNDPCRHIVRVTFIGGPLHGVQQEMDAPEDRLWRDFGNGTAVLYALRWTSSATPSPHAHYAPVGMSEHAYGELLSSLRIAAPATQWEANTCVVPSAFTRPTA